VKLARRFASNDAKKFVQETKPIGGADVKNVFVKKPIKSPITSSNLAPAIGPYSPAILSKSFLFLSGSLGIDHKGNLVSNDVEGQAEQALKNMGFILKEAGLTHNDIVKTTIFLTDIQHFAKVNQIYAKYFSEPFPARTTIAVSALPKGGLVEIEAIASQDVSIDQAKLFERIKALKTKQDQGNN